VVYVKIKFFRLLSRTSPFSPFKRLT